MSRHQLLYLNPYPKPGQRGKRWAGHPALPVAVQLGRALEVRCHWLPYIAPISPLYLPSISLYLPSISLYQVRSNWLPYCLELREAVAALAYAPPSPTSAPKVSGEVVAALAQHDLAHSPLDAEGGGGGGEVPAHVRAAAAALLPARLSVLRLESAAQALTLFEAKYYRKKDPLYRLKLGRGIKLEA